MTTSSAFSAQTLWKEQAKGGLGGNPSTGMLRAVRMLCKMFQDVFSMCCLKAIPNPYLGLRKGSVLWWLANRNDGLSNMDCGLGLTDTPF